MKKLSNLFKRNIAKIFAVTTTSSLYLKSQLQNAICESQNKIYTHHLDTSEQKSIKDYSDKDIIIIIDIDFLIDKYIQQTDNILKQIKQQFPDCEILSIKSEQKKQFQIDNIDGETFIVLKRKDQNELKELKHSDFFYQSQIINTFFEDLQSIDDFNKINLNKFNYLIGFCEQNQKAENYIKNLQTRKEYVNQEVNFYKFDSCSKVQSTNQDLIILKKSSKFNSIGQQNQIKIDNKFFDVVKAKNFFSNEQQMNSIDQVIQKKIKKICVFNPKFFQQLNQESYFDIILEVDENKITNRQKHDLMQKIKNLKQELPTNLKKQINFYYAQDNMEESKDHVIKIVNNEHLKLSHFYYSFNKDKSTLKNVIKRYPELVNKTYENYVYEFPLEQNPLNKESFIEFLKKVKNQEIQCQSYSEKDCTNKYSNKLVYDNFQSILQDENDHIVFFYSNNCHMCKQLQQYFEKECMKNLINKDKINLKFHRINNDLNSFYMSTPVIAYFKNDQQNPYIFDSQHINQDSIKDFINICYNISVTKISENIYKDLKEIN